MTARTHDEALPDSGESLRVALDSMPDPVMITDDDGHFTFVSSNVSSALGYTADEVAATGTIARLVGRQLVDAAELAARGEIRNIECVIPSKDGAQRHFLATAKGVSIGRGTALYVCRDVTDCAGVETGLSDYEERMRLALEASQIGLWDWDVRNDIWYASSTYYTMLGYEPRPGPLDRSEWLARVHPDDRAVVEAKIQKVLAQDFKSYEYEARMRNAEGAYRWVNVAGFGITRDAQGSVTRVIGTRMDITDRKLAEEALKDEISRRRILVEQSRDGIVVLDEDGNVDEANFEFAHMLGYSMEEMLSLHVWDWESTIPKAAVLEMLKSVDMSGDHFVTRHRRKDGGHYEVEISTNGAVYGGKKYIFCVCRDVTQAKQAETEREALIKELQEALAEIKVLRGIVPLCTYCKKVRDDEGYWEQVEVYIQKHSTADVTHGICPECLKEHFPDLYSGETYA